MNILIINGPNLNLLGQRQPEIYGYQDFDSYLQPLRERYRDKVNIDFFQSNIEGEIIDCIQTKGAIAEVIIINAGAYTHTSIAIADAIAAVKTPTVEVHISNIYSREAYRHESKLAMHCEGVISGFGLDVYRLAISHFIDA